MLGAIRHALANLANPHGRDARQTFWFWVLALFLLRFGAGLMVSIPMTAKIMATAVHSVKVGQPENPAAITASITRIVTDALPTMIWLQVGLGVVTMALLCTSLIRRAHDSELPGWVVLVPGALYAGALAQMPGQIGQVMAKLQHMDPTSPPSAMTMTQGQGGLALLSYGAAALVLWIGTRSSSFGPNRFGPEPTRF